MRAIARIVRWFVYLRHDEYVSTGWLRSYRRLSEE
jgi:hypothetical protein